VSTFIQPVTPVSTDAAVKPETGTTSVSSGTVIAVTDPNSSAATPTILEAPDSGIFEVVSASEGSNIIVEGDGTAALAIGNAVDGAGTKLSASGTTYQIADDYQGSAVVNLNGAITSDTKVDTSTETPEGNTIADNAPTGASGFDFYVKTGAGNDQVEGSSGSDFIRLGAGDDTFNAGAGDDVVRVGLGNDSGSLGAGDDTLYLTVDQLQGVNVNTITDFDANGDDQIQIDADIEDLVEIDGVGTNAITISLSGAQEGVTAIFSEGVTIDEDDIEFV